MVQVVTCSTQALWNKNMAVGRVNSVLRLQKADMDTKMGWTRVRVTDEAYWELSSIDPAGKRP